MVPLHCLMRSQFPLYTEGSILWNSIPRENNVANIIPIMMLLCERGAKMDVKDVYDETPASYAQKYKYPLDAMSSVINDDELGLESWCEIA